MSIILLKSFKLHLLIYLWICKYISLPKSFPAGQKMSLLHCQVHCQRNFPHSADGCENKLCTHVILHRAAQTVGTRSRTLANNAGLVLVEIVLKWCKFLHKSPIIELPKHFNLQSAWGRLGQTSVSLSWQEADKFQFLCYEKVFWKHIKKNPHKLTVWSRLTVFVCMQMACFTCDDANDNGHVFGEEKSDGKAAFVPCGYFSVYQRCCLFLPLLHYIRETFTDGSHALVPIE